MTHIPIESPSSEALLERVAAINKRLGRPLRVLHIGNIANNAYLNSKLLNEYGVESHVLCYDYYHVMGTPEWEDAFFDSQRVDHFRPVWRDVELRGFERPTWFCQGPLDLCVQYLLSLQSKEDAKRLLIEWQLAGYNLTKRPSLLRILREPKQILSLMIESFTRICRSPSVKDEYYARYPRKSCDSGALSSLVIRVAVIPIYAMALLVKRLKLNRFVGKGGYGLDVGESSNLKGEFELRLLKEFGELFPNRPDRLTKEDFAALRALPIGLQRVLDYYDVVHAYATDSWIPMSLGKSNYVAYEHGTIRTLPFQDRSFSRIVALAYAKAGSIISTNADCLPSARRLQSDSRRIVRGLHGFDERQVLKRLQYAQTLDSPRVARFNIPDDVAVFLHPARQDWDIKGNDLLLRAILALKEKSVALHRPFVVVLAEWGNDVSRAKEFIRKHRLDELVQWSEILSKSRLVHAVSRVDAVIDQFKIPCIGAVPPEFLTVSGGPVITFLDDQMMAEFYGEPLPVLNANSADSIAEKMKMVINRDPQVAENVKKAKDWVARKHSHRNVVEGCLEAYEIVLSSNSSDGQK